VSEAGSAAPRPSRAEAKARTRARLLDAATQVVAQKGFTEASLKEIAEAAGFTIGAVYSNFASKDELFAELLAERSNPQHVEAAAILAQPDASADDVHAALDRLLADAADQESDLGPLQAEIWLYAVRRPELRQRLADQFRDRREALTESMASRAPGDEAAPADLSDLATILMALYQGFVQLRRADPSLVPDGLYGTAASWLFGGILSAPGDGEP
jgi:AcrR family transcriptional regulator